MTASPQTLFDIAGIQARIHTLPGRLPFMMASDLAEVYQTEPFRLNRAMDRNPKRFPEDFAFRLTEAETAQLKSQNGISMKANRDFPMAYTQAGAYALSGVLTSDVAIDVGIAIYRAFAAMEAAALAEAKAMLVKFRFDASSIKRVRNQVILGVQAGLTFEGIWRLGNYSKWKVAEALKECLALDLIDRLPEGMPLTQGDLFGHV
jgi:hypothetical protein